MRIIPALILAAVTVQRCGPVPQPTPPPPIATAPATSTPNPRATATTTPRPGATSTPVPPPSDSPHPITSGRIVLELHGLSGLPLSPTRDNLAVLNLVAEQSGEPLDRSRPVLEIAARGYNTEPCLTPGHCDRGDTMGLEVTYSANLLYEDGGDYGACGHGSNYHRRLAIGSADPVVVTIDLGLDRVRVATPVDAVEWSTPASSSMVLSQLIQGAPWPQGPKRGQKSWCWTPLLDGAPFGARATIREWTGSIGAVADCP